MPSWPQAAPSFRCDNFFFASRLQAASDFVKGPIYALLNSSITPLAAITKLRLSRSLSALISAWAGLWLLQTGQLPTVCEDMSEEMDGNDVTKPGLAGNTIDITLLTVTRAVDVIIGMIWARHQVSRKARGRWTKVCIEIKHTKSVRPKTVS